MFLSCMPRKASGWQPPQVGVYKRLMVYHQSGDKTTGLDEAVMVDPQITEFSESKDIDTEACLSFPDTIGQAERSK